MILVNDSTTTDTHGLYSPQQRYRPTGLPALMNKAALLEMLQEGSDASIQQLAQTPAVPLLLCVRKSVCGLLLTDSPINSFPAALVVAVKVMSTASWLVLLTPPCGADTAV